MQTKSEALVIQALTAESFLHSCWAGLHKVQQPPSTTLLGVICQYTPLPLSSDMAGPLRLTSQAPELGQQRAGAAVVDSRPIRRQKLRQPCAFRQGVGEHATPRGCGLKDAAGHLTPAGVLECNTSAAV